MPICRVLQDIIYFENIREAIPFIPSVAGLKW
jgi:hypothetical protein